MKLGPEDFLGREQHTCQKSSRMATVTKTGQTCFPNRSDRFRPDRQEKHNPRKPPLLPTNRSPDSPNGLQPNFGARWTTSWATSISRDPSWNASKREESKVNYQEHLFRVHPKTTKSNMFRRVCWSKITKQRGTRSSYVTSNKKPSKKRHQNFSKEIPRKSSENHQKGKMGRTQTSLEEPRQIIYIYHERFIQGLASTRSFFPLTRSHHEALKLVL
jgi:hypothetical protein